MDVDLKIRLKNETDAGLKAVVSGAEKAAQKIGTASERASAKAAEAAEKGAARSRSSHQKMAQAREVLEVRSSQTIAREIKQVEAAYARLKASGSLSWREQAAAADKMRGKVTSLTNEMGKLTAAQKAMGAAKGAFAIGAGLTAAAYTVKNPAMEAMSYDRRLAHMANTAYGERDFSGRKAGMKTLEEAINKARRAGGGTREDAAEALDTMIASGVVSDTDAMKMLPGLVKAATASGTAASEMATIAIRAQQSFKISADDLPQILSAAMSAGQAGGFELKDMAKWLPQQMAMARNLGLSGKEGFAKLAAWNQASVITAGTKDEGGNNLRDLLNELNTPHFKRFLGEQLLGGGQPAKRGQKVARSKEIDALFLSYQDRGIDKVTAMMDVADKIFAKDKRYQDLQTKLKALPKEDKGGRQEVLEAMLAQVQGSNVGKIFHNQQSLMAFLGLMNNREYTQDVLQKVRGQYQMPDEKSAIGSAHELIASTGDYKVEQAKGDEQAAEKAMMDRLTPAIGKAASAFSDLAQKHPDLASGIVLGTKAITAFALAAGASTLLMGGAAVAGGGVVGKAATLASSAGASIASAATGAAAAVSSAAAAAGGATGLAIGGAGVLGAGAVGYGVGTGINWGAEKLARGTRLEGVGTDVIGGGIAKTLAFFGNENAREMVAINERAGQPDLTRQDKFMRPLRPVSPPLIPSIPFGSTVNMGGGVYDSFKETFAKPEPAKPLEVNAKFQVALAPGLVLQNQSMQANGGKVQFDTGNRWLTP